MKALGNPVHSDHVPPFNEELEFYVLMGCMFIRFGCRISDDIDRGESLFSIQEIKLYIKLFVAPGIRIKNCDMTLVVCQLERRRNVGFSWWISLPREISNLGHTRWYSRTKFVSITRAVPEKGGSLQNSGTVRKGPRDGRLRTRLML